MWNWILDELKTACRITGVSKHSGTEAEDVISEVCLQLIANPEYAKEIYEGKKTWLLLKLVKAQIYDSKSKLSFDNRTEFSRYQKISLVCEKYGIEPIPENAYKIEAVMDSGSMSISTIAVILSSKKKMIRVGNDDYENLPDADAESVYNYIERRIDHI